VFCRQQQVGGQIRRGGVGGGRRIYQPRREVVRDVDRQREHVHGHVDQNGTGPTAACYHEGRVEGGDQRLGALHMPDPLAPGPVRLRLAGVGVKQRLHVCMAALEIALHVPGDHDHRNVIESRVGYPGQGIGHAGPEMAKNNLRLTGHPGVCIGSVSGSLFMVHADETDLRWLQRGEHRHDRMTAQPKNVLHSVSGKHPDQSVGATSLRHVSLPSKSLVSY